MPPIHRFLKINRFLKIHLTVAITTINPSQIVFINKLSCLWLFLRAGHIFSPSSPRSPTLTSGADVFEGMKHWADKAWEINFVNGSTSVGLLKG